MNRRLFLGVGICTALLVACSATPTGGGTNSPVEPPELTKVADDIKDFGLYRKCDSKNLVYVYYHLKAGGIAVIPNATECL